MKQELIEEYKICLNLTFENIQLENAKSLSLKLIELDKSELIPYLCLSSIYATEENWIQCEKVTEIALEIDELNTMLYNHMGVAICSQSNDRILEGLYYFKKGFELGDEQNCGKNYLYWYNKISN